MNLAKALRASKHMRLALVGAGGKSSTLFQLARQFVGPVLVSASTHLAMEQITLGDCYIRLDSDEPRFDDLAITQGVTLITGPVLHDEQRVAGLKEEALEELKRVADRLEIPMLLESDGARSMSLKAPAEHEPAIPPWVNTVVVVVGLSAIGKPLDSEHVHRPERFAALTGLEIGRPITEQSVVAMLKHPQGGLRNIPVNAQRFVLFNQADDEVREQAALRMAAGVLPEYDGVLIGAVRSRRAEGAILRVVTNVSGVVLAGGESKRFGAPKQLLDYHGTPFIRRVAQTAIDAGLDPVTVVIGAVDEPIRRALAGLPVKIVKNPEWAAGQSTSLRAGVRSLPARTGGAIFLLSDQPQVTPELLRALTDRHQTTMSPVVAPFVGEQRANPILFDRAAMQDLFTVSGDQGGRAILMNYRVERVDWPDDTLLLDVDTHEDYKRLIERTSK